MTPNARRRESGFSSIDDLVAVAVRIVGLFSGWMGQRVASVSAKRPPLGKAREQAGFTLLELMITVAIAAILLTVGVPSFRSVIQNNRAAIQTNDLLSALSLARSEAVKRGAAVSVCPSATQSACSGGTDWSVGWIVYLEGTDPEVLRVWPAPAGIDTFTGPSSVRYRGTGDVDNPSGDIIKFTHKTAGCTGDLAREINISVTGHATVTRNPC